MRLTVYSHKPCWTSPASPTGVATDGGFPFQMRALSELFDATTVLVPVAAMESRRGETLLCGHNLTVRALTIPSERGAIRKVLFPLWALRNASALVGEALRADAVHTPIPGDVGTVGMLLAWLLRKRLFVRHCGNWFEQKTAAERFWRWFIDRFAGGRNVMLVTGGSSEAPSAKPNVRWVFSTSLGREQLARLGVPRTSPPGASPRLVIAARQDVQKGAGVVIESLSLLTAAFPGITLDVLGDGPALTMFRDLALRMGIAERVTFHGAVSHAEVMDHFRRADLLCFPTMASEGFPKVVLEALACGLPVVTSAVSVLPRLVGTRCGITLSTVSPEAVANAVRELLSDSQRYVEVSRQAVITAQDYSLERWRNTIGGLLKEAWGPTRGQANGAD